MKTDRIKLLLAVSIALTLLSGIITYYAIQESRHRVELVFHTYEVINQGNEVLSMLKDAETGLRGYLLTNDSAYLEPYKNAEARITLATDSLSQLVSNSPEQKEYLTKTILPIIESRRSSINKALSLHRELGVASAVQFIKTNMGKMLMDSVRYHLTQFSNTQILLLKNRLEEMGRTHARQNLTRYVSFFLISLVSFVAFIALEKKQKQNQYLIGQLKDANEVLEHKVSDRTRELERQNESTREVNEELRKTMEEMESFYEALQIRNAKAEDTLKEIRDLYNNAPCGYHSLAADGTIVRMNERELGWLGYTREEVVGKMNVTQIVKPDEHRSYYEDFAKFKEVGFIKNKEHTFIRKDGSYFSVLLSSTALYDENGKYSMSRSTLIDITERKHVEQELIDVNKDLIRLNEEKNHFLGIAAHDLKSPLHSILGLINLIHLNQKNLTHEQQEYLWYIQRSCINMQTLIINLLDINKIEQGITVFSPEKVQLQRLSQELVRGFLEQAKRKNITLLLECNAPDKTIITDLNALVRILENLLSNAIKFSPKGKEVLIRITHNHSTVKFEVVDQGQGIVADEIPKLFRKFQKLQARPTDGESSTGLGLSIVKELVGVLRGKISVESEFGKGSTFTIELPVS